MSEAISLVRELLRYLPPTWAGCWHPNQGECPCHAHDLRRRAERFVVNYSERVPEPDRYSAHAWLLRALEDSEGCDPIDMANDAEYLAALLRQRANDVLGK